MSAPIFHSQFKCPASVQATALTAFPHPTLQMRGVQKKSLRYQREDGVELSATLYLPPGYEPKRDGPRPMLMWAYPREFKSAEAAVRLVVRPIVSIASMYMGRW